MIANATLVLTKPTASVMCLSYVMAGLMAIHLMMCCASLCRSPSTDTTKGVKWPL